jgi:hypothetical protein
VRTGVTMKLSDGSAAGSAREARGSMASPWSEKLFGRGYWYWRAGRDNLR